jgi:predicted deacylase
LRDGADLTPVDSPLVVTSYGPGRHRLARDVATTADGAEIRLPVNILRGRRDGPRLVAIAGIHGDEHDGPAALLDVCDELDPNDLHGTLVVVPIANPPAFRTATRRNVADGENLNRIFPGDPDGSISHRLARLLVDEVIPGADFMLTIHGWTTGWLTLPYVEYTASHKTTEAARAGAAAFGLSQMEPLGMLPGRLMSTVAGMGIPGCEVEIGGEGITLPARADIGRRGVIGLLRHLRMIAGEPAIPDDQRDVTRYETRAALGGVFRRARGIEVGREIGRNDALGTICGMNGEPLREVVASADGIVACLRHALSVEPGDLIAVVFADA